MSPRSIASARGYTGDMSSIELLTKERSSRNDCGARATCWFSACDLLVLGVRPADLPHVCCLKLMAACRARLSGRRYPLPHAGPT